jgi:hypothetical protein
MVEVEQSVAKCYSFSMNIPSTVHFTCPSNKLKLNFPVLRDFWQSILATDKLTVLTSQIYHVLAGMCAMSCHCWLPNILNVSAYGLIKAFLNFGKKKQSVNQEKMGTTVKWFFLDDHTVGTFKETYSILCETLPNRNICKGETRNASMSHASTDLFFSSLFVFNWISHIPFLSCMVWIHYLTKVQWDFYWPSL